ncbi:MAG: polysaccharide biosynthesis/export family protein [Terracidiphilus sp.]
MPMRHVERGARRMRWALAFGALAGILATTRCPAQAGMTVNANVEESGAFSARRPQPALQAGLKVVPEGFESLKLAPGFLLQMDVYGAPEMSTELRIDAQGNASLPLIGLVQVAGNTVLQAQDAIAKAYADQEILKNPQVALNVVQYAASTVAVMGEVQSPGRIELLAPESLSDVLALAGGETAIAGNEVEIQHRAAGGETTRHIRFSQESNRAVWGSSLVEPGDTVLVHRAGIIYVLGAVNRPGGYLMVNGGALNAIQAIALAGGETLQASARWALLVRRQEDGFAQIKVPLKKMEEGEAAPMPLELNDALYVPASNWKSFVLNGSSVLSAAAAASIYAASAP